MTIAAMAVQPLHTMNCGCNALAHLLAMPSVEAPETSNEAATTTAPATAPAEPEKPPEDISTQLVTMFGPTFEKTGWADWSVLFGAIFGGLLIGRITQATLKRIGVRLQSRGWLVRGAVFQHASNPANLLIFAFFLQIGLKPIYFDPQGELATIPGKLTGLLLVIALAWFLYNLVDIVEIAIRRVTADDTIIQLIRKTIRIFVLIVFGLFVAENTFGANISAWLAGLGLAGLAVSLAAQGPIKNIFGSVTVVLDRPFGLGDRIKFGSYSGVVEEMGFRSTKLRSMDGHLITIPNMKLIDDIVENITARPSIRRELNVTITYDTPPDKVELALKIIKDLLSEPFMHDTFEHVELPPRVVFNNFNADSLNILVLYWYQLNVEGRDWWSYLAQSEQFNMRLLKSFNAAGIEFAFPSHTVYLAGDSNRRLAIDVGANGEARSQAGGHSRQNN